MHRSVRCSAKCFDTVRECGEASANTRNVALNALLTHATETEAVAYST